MAQDVTQQAVNNCADLGKEILSLLRLRQGQVKVSLLRNGGVLIEKTNDETHGHLEIE